MARATLLAQGDGRREWPSDGQASNWRIADVTQEIVGRTAELSSLADFLASERWPRALVLTGGPGIGKTTLWDAAVAQGRGQGVRVIAARASGADTRLSFAALIDLLDGIGDEDFAGLPPPQRTALEVALYRSEPTGTPPEAHAIALGLLNVAALAHRARPGARCVGRCAVARPRLRGRARLRRRPSGRRAGRIPARPPSRGPVQARARPRPYARRNGSR